VWNNNGKIAIIQQFASRESFIGHSTITWLEHFKKTTVFGQFNIAYLT
jgi:hypothetical protein